MTLNLLKVLIAWIKYLINNSILINTNNGLLLFSPLHFFCIFTNVEKLIIQDFLNHVKLNKLPLFTFENNNTYLLTSDLNIIIDLLIININLLYKEFNYHDYDSINNN